MAFKFSAQNYYLRTKQDWVRISEIPDIFQNGGNTSLRESINSLPEVAPKEVIVYKE